MSLQGAPSVFVRCLTPRRQRLTFADHAAISARRLSRFRPAGVVGIASAPPSTRLRPLSPNCDSLAHDTSVRRTRPLIRADSNASWNARGAGRRGAARSAWPPACCRAASARGGLCRSQYRPGSNLSGMRRRRTFPTARIRHWKVSAVRPSVSACSGVQVRRAFRLFPIEPVDRFLSDRRFPVSESHDASKHRRFLPCGKTMRSKTQRTRGPLPGLPPVRSASSP